MRERRKGSAEANDPAGFWHSVLTCFADSVCVACGGVKKACSSAHGGLAVRSKAELSKSCLGILMITFTTYREALVVEVIPWRGYLSSHEAAGFQFAMIGWTPERVPQNSQRV